MKNDLPKIARAKELRAMGLSLVATANAAGLDYETVLNVCSGIRPAVQLPDLPGMSMPYDIAPRRHPSACPDHTVAKIQEMRAARYTMAEISRVLGVGISTVSNYAPRRASTRPTGTDKREKVTPEIHREIHRLRFIEAMSYDKISAKLVLSKLTVRRYVRIPPQ